MNEDVRPLTYRELRDRLNELTEEQLDESATIASGPIDSTQTEFFPIFDTDTTGEEVDVFDPNHPFLISDF